jgi:hypothetical protein
VQGLAGVDDVEQPVGSQVADAVTDGGQVGGAVTVAAVALAEEQWDRRAVASREAVVEDTPCAVADLRDTGGLKLGGDIGELVKVGSE